LYHILIEESDSIIRKLKMAPRVLVTGVSGWIAAWVALCAQRLGYQVRGTVRSLQNKEKVEFLQNLCPGAKFPIELVEADLNSDDGWQAAIADVDYILHVASPYVIAEPRDPNEVITPAVEGTLRVLRFASEATVRPKRVVITSSSVAVMYGQEKTEYTDDDWSDVNSTKYPMNAYGKSKTLAERAAWDFVGQLPPEKKLDICTINPTFVLGPMLSGNDHSSASVMKQIILAEFPAIPNMQIDYISVFDVARAHLLAMTNPNAVGKRFVLCAGDIKFGEIAQLIAREFKPKGYSPVTMVAPKFVVRLLAFFGDRQAQGIISSIGRVLHVSSHNAKNILGLELKEDRNLFLEMTYAAIHAGLIPDKSKNQEITRTYQRPEIDLSMIPPAE